MPPSFHYSRAQMSEPIKPGDLVQVVRPTLCCGRTDLLGLTFVAGEFCGIPGKCGWCNTGGLSGPKHPDKPFLYIDVRILKRIPPFPELADEHHDEEITA